MFYLENVYQLLVDRPIKIPKCQFKLLREHSLNNIAGKEIHSRIVQHKNKRKIYYLNQIKENMNIEAYIPKEFREVAKRITGSDKLGPDKLNTVSTLSSLKYIKKLNKNKVGSKTANEERRLTLEKIKKIEKILKNLSPEMKKMLDNYEEIKKHLTEKKDSCDDKKDDEKHRKLHLKYKKIFPKLKKLRRYQKILKFHKLRLELQTKIKDGVKVKTLAKKINA